MDGQVLARGLVGVQDKCHYLGHRATSSVIWLCCCWAANFARCRDATKREAAWFNGSWRRQLFKERGCFLVRNNIGANKQVPALELNEAELEKSAVVVNGAMNRGRTLTGINSYSRELHINIMEFLLSRISNRRVVRWLDLCCGEGNALIDAAGRLDVRNKVEIIGVDLVPLFRKQRDGDVKLYCLPIRRFVFSKLYDLITCVHGMHYIGDKLAVLAKAGRSVKSDGLFLANLALGNIRVIQPRISTLDLLTSQGFQYNRHARVVSRCGISTTISFGVRYLGADTHAGANYTRQSVVTSYYSLSTG